MYTMKAYMYQARLSTTQHIQVAFQSYYALQDRRKGA